MRAYWSDVRPNGKPLESGVLYVQDPENGENPIFTYGADQEEVLAKVARTNMHAQQAMRTRQAAPPAAPPAEPIVIKPKMNADEHMRATVDLGDPAKAGSATVRLFEDQTGLDVKRLVAQQFGQIAMDWQLSNPQFYAHPGNKKMLADTAKSYVGGDLGRVTGALLTRAYQELSAQGYLIEAPASTFEPAPNQAPQPVPLPGESPVQRMTRPRGEPTFQTSVPSTRYGAPQRVPTKTPKYTEDQIMDMPESERMRLLESNDRDYAEACELYFGATA